ncbi:MAG: sigma-70 family RNA polymerase sigma factor [candidate division KSB1 bacterium]|jgi:RNA polymerase sigma-70 factor (ECF subfamily)|nr:sigma-70 family RNA polymerase sigma factor [candidate division KSB1 bacterium]
MNDADLIKKYLDGDINSFNTLVWRWEKPLYNFSVRFLGDTELAKDVTQKAFIKAYKNLKGLKDPSKFSSWIYQITSNLCKDEFKSMKRHQSISLELMMENHKDHRFDLADSSLPDPSADMNQIELEELIKRALQSIPVEQRIVIIMKEYQGLKFAEIAETLGESINTVKSRMYYGLNALRKVFNRWNINEEVLQYEM